MSDSDENKGYGNMSAKTPVYESGDLTLTIEEAKVLTQLSYLDFDYPAHAGLEGVNNYNPVGNTVGKVLKDIADGNVTLPSENGALAPDDYIYYAKVWLGQEVRDGLEPLRAEILNLRYDNYINQNVSKEPGKENGNGLVVATLTNGKQIIILSTGSEGGADSKISGTIPFTTYDWVSDATIGAGKGDASVQADLQKYMASYKAGGQPIIFLGHSRGNMISQLGAAYLLENGYDPSKMSIVGISGANAYYSLTPEQRALLGNIPIINYVNNGDPIPYIGPPIGSILVLAVADKFFKTKLDKDGVAVQRDYLSSELDLLAHYPLGSFKDENGNYRLAKQDFMPIFIQRLTSYLAATNPDLIDKLLNYLVGIETDLQRQVKEEAERIDGLKYVVHGATLKCSRGLRNSRLLLKVSNGVYIHDKAQADIYNNSPDEVIQFCGCCSTKNPSTKDALSEATQAVQAQSSAKMQQAAANVKSSFLKTYEDADVCAAYGACASQPLEPWQLEKDTVFLNEEEALLRRSILACRYEGIISIVHEGQLE